MTYKMHWGMCLFAEGMTGIPEIDECRVKLVMVLRGGGKSSCITTSLPLQKALKHDGYSTGLINETQALAEAFTSTIKLEFEQNNLLRALFPERIPDNFRETTWKTDEIVIKRGKPRPMSPTVLARGVGASIVGRHLDMFICDDLISREAAEAARRGNFEHIDQAYSYLRQLEPLLCSPKRDPILIIGTPWYMGDIYELIQGTDELPGLWGKDAPKEEFRWQLKLPDGEYQNLTLYRKGEMAIFERPCYDEAGNSIFPERYTNEELETMREQDAAFFAANYLLKPAAGGAAEFKESWLRYYHREGEFIRFVDKTGKPEYIPIADMHVLVSVDPAFSKKRDAARTAIPVIGIYGDNLFLLEDFAERGMTAHDMAEKVVGFCTAYPVKDVFVETIVAQIEVGRAIQGALEKAGMPHVQVNEIPSHGDQRKNVRIYGMQRFFQTGHFYIDKRHHRFVTEFISFPRGVKDILDACAFQIQKWETLLRQGVGGPRSITNSNYVQADLERLRRAFRR